MAKRVLIIDDDVEAAELMAKLCRTLTLEPVVVTHPREALPALAESSPALVILDLLLPGVDGVRLGAEMRATRNGGHVPILAVSGVLRRSAIGREVEQELGGEFLSKPFDAHTFRTTVARLLGLPPPRAAAPETPVAGVRAGSAGPAPFEVDLAAEPVARLFARLYAARASGRLELTRGRHVRRLHFHLGRVRHAVSNAKTEQPGALEAARGALDPERFEAAVRLAAQQHVPLTQALLAAGAFDGAGLESAVAAQVHEVAVRAVAWTDGRGRFTPEPPEALETLPDHPVHPLAAVVEGVRRFQEPADLRRRLAGRADGRLQPTALFRRETFILRSSTPGEGITPRIDGNRTLGEVLAAARDADLPLLFALLITGLVGVQSAHQTPDDETRPAPAAPGGASPRARPPTPDEAAARQAIAAMHARLAEATHYQALGVAPDAGAAAIQAAARQLSLQWHPDRFAGLELGAQAALLQAIFQRVGEARRVLGDSKSRQEYDVYLDRKAKGLPTDVGAVLRAEQLFEEGVARLKSGRASEALARLDEALALNDTEPEYFAWRGWARLQAGGDEAQARADLDRALADRPELAAAHYALGMVAAQAGDVDEAEARFVRVLKAEPTHHDAQSQLRLIRMRRDKEKGGLLKRLLKR